MSLVADALQPQLVRGLLTTERQPGAVALADLLGKVGVVGYDLSFNASNNEIVADFRDPAALVTSYAFDSARFASAAFQTMWVVSSKLKQKEEIAWNLIGVYYAAFYAGHSLIRLFGDSCSYFDREHVTHISTLANVVGLNPSFRINSGVYKCTVNASADIVTCASIQRGGGGTHESFWNVFGARMRSVGDHVLQGALQEREAQIVFAQLETLQQTSQNHVVPAHRWISVVRNEIQYRHGHKVWHPCKVRKHEREQLERLTSQWCRDPLDVDAGPVRGGQLGEFVAICTLIVSLCRIMWIRISERSIHKRNSFATLGPIACLRQAGCI